MLNPLEVQIFCNENDLQVYAALKHLKERLGNKRSDFVNADLQCITNITSSQEQTEVLNRLFDLGMISKPSVSLPATQCLLDVPVEFIKNNPKYLTLTEAILVAESLLEGYVSPIKMSEYYTDNRDSIIENVYNQMSMSVGDASTEDFLEDVCSLLVSEDDQDSFHTHYIRVPFIWYEMDLIDACVLAYLATTKNFQQLNRILQDIEKFAKVLKEAYYLTDDEEPTSVLLDRLANTYSLEVTGGSISAKLTQELSIEDILATLKAVHHPTLVAFADSILNPKAPLNVSMSEEETKSGEEAKKQQEETDEVSQSLWGDFTPENAFTVFEEIMKNASVGDPDQSFLEIVGEQILNEGVEINPEVLPSKTEEDTPSSHAEAVKAVKEHIADEMPLGDAILQAVSKHITKDHVAFEVDTKNRKIIITY